MFSKLILMFVTNEIIYFQIETYTDSMKPMIVFWVKIIIVFIIVNFSENRMQPNCPREQQSHVKLRNMKRSQR